ncbi:MAG: DsbC family protein [Betaproteobacteria bacterium]|nr:DsbC family protein [Betaproteobacteria bacterium]
MKTCSRFSLAFLLTVTCSTVLADSADRSPQLFGGLPLNLAIKEVRGNGLRMLAVFEDPHCIYCRRLTRELSDLTDLTIYVFLYPILLPSSKNMSESIWCSPDRSKAWNAWMMAQTVPKAPSCDAGAIDQVTALGRSMNLRGVPAIFLANGERYTGGKSKFEIELAMSSPKVMSFQAKLGNKPD